jgi:hypothetical protein
MKRYDSVDSPNSLLDIPLIVRAFPDAPSLALRLPYALIQSRESTASMTDDGFQFVAGLRLSTCMDGRTVLIPAADGRKATTINDLLGPGPAGQGPLEIGCQFDTLRIDVTSFVDNEVDATPPKVDVQVRGGPRNTTDFAWGGIIKGATWKSRGGVCTVFGLAGSQYELWARIRPVNGITPTKIKFLFTLMRTGAGGDTYVRPGTLVTLLK